jgi:hypothetical protein
MKRWGCQIVAAWVISVPLWATAAEPDAGWVGTAGCSKRGCHNGPGEGTTAAYRLWSTVDPHSRAYDVLLEPLSQRMVKDIGLSTTAQDSELCLKCHSGDVPATAPKQKLLMSQGVSCEVCHGPASRWLEPHIRPAWRAGPKAAKTQLGLHDLSSPRARVETCVNCHVGKPGFEVTHDMLAAGHPRLLFEATAYFDHGLTRHWDEAKVRREDPQYIAKLWLIGQTSTFKHSLANLEARPPDRLFTEFADHDCYACHKSLDLSSAKVPGADSRTWGRWPAELLQLAEKNNLGIPQGTNAEVAQLRDQFQLSKFDRAMPLGALSNKFATWDSVADQTKWSPSQLRAIMLECASPIAPGCADWEVAWQRYRALTALSQSWSHGHEAAAKSLASPLVELKVGLRFPKGFVSPKGFDLAGFNRHLEAVRKMLAANP